MSKVYDMYRNRIQPGDIINYPIRKKSDTYMRTAKVLEVTERELEGEGKQPVLKVAMAKAPRASERRRGQEWPPTKIVKTVISVPHRTTIIPKSYVQNDKRYACLIDVQSLGRLAEWYCIGLESRSLGLDPVGVRILYLPLTNGVLYDKKRKNRLLN